MAIHCQTFSADPSSAKKFRASIQHHQGCKDNNMSTRIIVKNLPHNITASRLKSHFSSSQSGNAHFSGSVTDAKLVTDTKSGKSRGFAFIGYRTNEEAQKAVEWYNGTFVDMRKISVELAKSVCLSQKLFCG